MGVITFAAAGNSFGTFNAQGLGDPAIDPNALAISALIVQMRVPRPILKEVRHLLRYLLQALSLPMPRQEQVQRPKRLADKHGVALCSRCFFVDASAQSQPVSR